MFLTTFPDFVPRREVCQVLTSSPASRPHSTRRGHRLQFFECWIAPSRVATRRLLELRSACRPTTNYHDLCCAPKEITKGSTLLWYSSFATQCQEDALVSGWLCCSWDGRKTMSLNMQGPAKVHLRILTPQNSNTMNWRIAVSGLGLRTRLPRVRSRLMLALTSHRLSS
jgi:hypothetical protein